MFLGSSVNGGGGLLLRALEIALADEHGGEDEVRHCVLGIEGDGLLELGFGGGLLGGVGALDEREGGVEVGAVGIDGEGALNLIEGLGAIVLREGDAGEQSHGVGVVGLLGENGVGLSRAPGILMGGEQERAEIEVRLDVFGVERDGALELGVAAGVGAELHVGLGKIVVRGGVVLIDLDGVRELDDGFLLLALGGVVLAALEVLELSDVGIAGATHQQTCADGRDQQRRTLHHSLSR